MTDKQKCSAQAIRILIERRKKSRCLSWRELTGLRVLRLRPLMIKSRTVGSMPNPVGHFRFWCGRMNGRGVVGARLARESEFQATYIDRPIRRLRGQAALQQDLRSIPPHLCHASAPTLEARPQRRCACHRRFSGGPALFAGKPRQRVIWKQQNHLPLIPAKRTLL